MKDNRRNNRPKIKICEKEWKITAKLIFFER